MPSIIEQVETYHQATPFRPFALVLADGRRIVIGRAEHLGQFPSRDRVFVSTPDDATETIDVSRIARVELEPASGRTPRKRAG